MKYFFKFLLNFINVLGIHINVDYSSDKREVASFIKKLRPKKTNFDLIRIGPNGDGGYLVPDDLDTIEACFSPGVDIISDFELDCYRKGMQIFLADKSVDKPNLKISKDQYYFIKKFIGTINNEDFITMDAWVDSASISKDSDLLLQMDIEGHEYSSLLTISSRLMNRFRVIVIEFHDLHKLWNKEFLRLAQSTFSKVLDSHVCVHIHPNNCCGIDIRKGLEIPRVAEFTFIRKDRIKEISNITEFPHQLDFDNTDKKSIVLPKIWYQQST